MPGTDETDRVTAADRRTRLLLVEDDPALSEMTARLLDEHGYDVSVAADGQRGLHLALSSDFDLLVVDRGLPAVEGLDLIARLRGQGVTTPMIVLSARGSAQDRVAGLDAGAEDYLSKPFDVAELLARLRALLRRHGDTATVLAVPGGQLRIDERRVDRRDQSPVELSERESALLRLLASRPSQVFRRQDLLVRVFDDAESDAVIDTYVHYLRRKLGRGVITTVRGLGYRLGPL